MKRKLIYAGAALMTLASPMFAQTPGGGGLTGTLNLPAAYLALGISAGLCGLGQGKATAAACEAMARNPAPQLVSDSRCFWDWPSLNLSRCMR